MRLLEALHGYRSIPNPESRYAAKMEPGFQLGFAQLRAIKGVKFRLKGRNPAFPRETVRQFLHPVRLHRPVIIPSPPIKQFHAHSLSPFHGI